MIRLCLIIGDITTQLLHYGKGSWVWTQRGLLGESFETFTFTLAFAFACAIHTYIACVHACIQTYMLTYPHRYIHDIHTYIHTHMHAAVSERPLLKLFTLFYMVNMMTNVISVHKARAYVHLEKSVLSFVYTLVNLCSRTCFCSCFEDMSMRASFGHMFL